MLWLIWARWVYVAVIIFIIELVIIEVMCACPLIDECITLGKTPMSI